MLVNRKIATVERTLELANGVAYKTFDRGLRLSPEKNVSQTKVAAASDLKR
jgi:hypothetical protein